MNGLPDRLSEAAMARDRHDPTTARRALRDLALEDGRLRRWLAGARLLESVRLPAEEQYRVALVGTSTLDQTARAIELAGLIPGLDVACSTSPFGQYEAAVLDPSGKGFAALSDAVVLLPDVRARPISAWNHDPVGVAEEWVEQTVALWHAIRTTAPDARILQANLVSAPEYPLGTLQRTDRRGRDRVVREVNDRLVDRAGDDVSIIDIATLAAQIGLEQWFDDRYWYHAKQAVALHALPRLAKEIVGVLAASLGRTRKVVVMDLDDTLWGGTVGEDGVAGLRLGGDPVGEAHLGLQHYLCELRARGIVLAVCSKNDDALAREPFATRDDMLLTLDDFSVFVANWKPKSDNLRRIADDLDVGLDALVFLDDNPAEREQVRMGSPQIDVIELPIEPADFVRALDAYPLLDPLVLTDEDAARTEQYRARAQVKVLERDSDTIDDFLSGLDMVAEIRGIDRTSLPRVAQLVGKTNQWNLTTRRHDAPMIQQFVDDPRAVTLTARLRDRFGDHGLVAVTIALIEQDTAVIDTLLMSCRVIGRRLEHTLIATLAERLEEHGVETLVGEYIRTERNSLVAEVYPLMGFAPVVQEEASIRWCISVKRARSLATPYIHQQQTAFSATKSGA